MCGITGVYNHHGRPDPESLASSLRLLAHRGPDSQGTYFDPLNRVALGHARLSIIDLEGGQQPLKSRDGLLSLVANGEIYNYKEVLQQTSPSLGEPLTKSDCEAILQVYAESGVQGFRQLNGMFAFALYDETEEALHVCRDRLGIKPLYYCETKNGFFFASEIKALLPYLDQQPSIRESSLSQFLQHQFNTGRETIFREISRVLPGEFLTISGGKIEKTQYWSATDHLLADSTNSFASFDHAVECFDELFGEVLYQHTRADVPFGLFLSGGIDSSILLAKLSEIHSQPIETYSIGYQDTHMESELDAAESLANHFGTKHHSLKVSQADLFQRIVHSTWCADDLMRDYATLPTHLLSEYAARNLKVVFSGEGGDEAFAGYRRYRPTFGRKIFHGVLGREVRIHSNWDDERANDVFLDSMKACDSREALLTQWGAIPSNLSYMQKRQLFDVRGALTDNLLVKADRMMMGFGLEGRVPFTDHRIIEFGLSLPDSYKYPKARGKWLLREWAKSHLPETHLAKPKRGFYVPIKEWLQGEFYDSLSEKLLDNQAISNWFSRSGTKNLLAAHRANGKHSREVWGLMQFAIWHRLFIESPNSIPNPQENPLDWL